MRLSEFQTFNDPDLETVLGAVRTFLENVRENRIPYTLALVGPSGTGKTALARCLWRGIAGYGNISWRSMGKDENGREAFYQPASRSCGWHYWPDVADGFKSNIWSPCDDIPAEWFAVIDDVGAEYDPNKIAAGKLDQILRRSGGKWRVITSNLLLKQISDTLDPRIASWLIRDENRVVEIKSRDFATR